MKNLYDHTAEEIKAMKKVYIVTHIKTGCQGKSAYLNYEDAKNSIEGRAIETQSSANEWRIMSFYLL